MLATDLGSRTTRIKMGTAVVILPLWHPLRVAENIALLDQMLKGRVEIGLAGRVSRTRWSHLIPGLTREIPKALAPFFPKVWRSLKKALSEEFFSHSGEYYELPPKGFPGSSREGFEDDPRWIKDGEVYKLYLVPKPYQKPHPPFSMAISTEGSPRWQPTWGLKPIAWRQTAKKLRDWVAIYKNARVADGHECEEPGKDWGVLRQFYVAPTMEEARKIYEPYFLEMIRYRAATVAGDAGVSRPGGGSPARSGAWIGSSCGTVV